MPAALNTLSLPSFQQISQFYHDNKNFRYALYAAGVISSYTAGLYLGRKTVCSLLIAGTAIDITYSVGEARKKIHSMNKKLILAELTDSVFKTLLAASLVLSGYSLSSLQQHGKSFLDGIASRNPYTVISALRNMTEIYGYLIPLALFGLRQCENYFHQEGNVAVKDFVLSVYDALKSKKMTDFIGKLIMEYLKPHVMDETSKFSEDLLRLMQYQSIGEMKPQDITAALSIVRKLFQDKTTFYRPANPTPLDKARITANAVLFQGLTFLFTSARIYYYPIPTAAAFACGLFYPTQIRSKRDLADTWEKFPDFFGPNMLKVCRTIESRSEVASYAIDLGYPAAFWHGLWLAESFRYYVWPHLADKINLPIEPLIFTKEARANQWALYLGASDYAKISPTPDPDEVYNGFKQRVVQGKSPRKLLELAPTHTQQELNKAYKKFSLKVFPDRVPEKKEEADQLFKCLKLAKDLLQKELDRQGPRVERPPEPVPPPAPENPQQGDHQSGGADNVD